MLFAGGGTGGHVYPGIAIYESLAEQVGGVDAMFLGTRGGMEEQILQARGLPHALIAGRGLRGASIATKLAAPIALARSVRDARGVIKSFEPDAVIGMGGFASAAAVIAAVIGRVKVVLQEQNSVPGLVNRRLARFADLVLLSYEESRRHIPRRVATAVIGNPLRAMPRVGREEAAEYFGLDAAMPTVLVIGGSRGARTLNMACAGAAAILAARRGVQMVLLTGEHDYEAVRKPLGDIADQVKVMPYLEDVHMAYAIADVAVARAGASSVFELAAWGIPTLFVPYPYAADDHQARNVAPLVEQRAALVMADREVDAKRISEIIASLLEDEDGRRRMKVALEAWARPDAARAAASLISDVLKKNAAETRPDRHPPAVTAERRSSLHVVRR